MLSISPAIRDQLVEILITFEPHGIFGSNVSCLFILTLSTHCYAKRWRGFRTFQAVLFLWIMHVISVWFCYGFMHVCLLMSCGQLLGKGWPLCSRFMMSNCAVVTFPLVSWVRCDAWLYRFLIFALFLTLSRLRYFSEMLITHEPHGILWSNFAYLYILR